MVTVTSSEFTLTTDRTFTYTDASGSHTQTRVIDGFVYAPTTPGDYPVVFFSAGDHADSEQGGGLTARMLAEQGYIVIIPKHLDDYQQPAAIENYFDRTNPQSTVERVLDMNYLSTHVAQIMEGLPKDGAGHPLYTANLDKPTIAGHSQGAFTAMMLTGVDSARPEFDNLKNDFFKAAILISPQGVTSTEVGKAPGDVTIDDAHWSGLYYQNAAVNSWTGVTVPTLTITGTEDSGDGGMTYQDRKDPFDYGGQAGRYAAVIKGADHFELGGFLSGLGETYVHRAERDVATSFLNAWIKGNATDLAALNDVQAYRTAHPDLWEMYEAAGVTHGGVAGGHGIIQADGYNNTLEGSGTADTILGAAGADVLLGGGGDDVLVGGPGADKMTGGAGADTFIFAPGDGGLLGLTYDQIMDFKDNGADHIDLTLFGGLTWRGTGAFTGADQVRVVASGADVLVHLNLDADATPEFTFKLIDTTLSQVTSSDFFL